jgi:lysine biosynthesis protein LysW
MIVLTCPKCRAELEVSNQQSGKVVKCPECGVGLKVPLPRKETPSKETQIRTTPSKSVAAVPPKTRSAERKQSASRQPLPKSEAKPASTSPWLIVGIVGGSLAFLAIVGTVVGIIAFRSTSGTSGTDSQSAAAQSAPFNPTKSANTVAVADTQKQDQVKPAAKNDESKKDRDDDIIESAAVSSTDIFKHSLKSVAWILNAQARGISMGTGTLIDQRNRLVLTNYHVIYGQGGQRFRIYFPIYKEKNGDVVVESAKFLRLAYNDQPNWGRVVDSDASKDLALIKIDFVPKDIQALPVAKVWVTQGQTVYSIGNSQAAGGASGSLWGYFDGKVRNVGHKSLPIRGHDMAFDISARMIETTSPSNPGDSGGPLINDRGELVGVTESYLAGARNVSLFVDGSEAVQFIENYFKKNGQQWARATNSLGVATADVSELVKKLESSDSHARSRAIRSLGRIGPPARLAVPSLLAMLSNSDGLVRQEVSDTLNKIGPPDKKDVALLQKTLQDSSPEARIYAATALGKLGQDGRNYVGSLVAVLKGDKDPAVRKSAAAALGMMGAFAKETVGPALIEALKDTEQDVRLAAAEGLGGMEVAASDIPQLVKALKHQDMEVRMFAARALGNLGPQAHGTVTDLMEAAKSGETQVSGAAIVALGQIGADANRAVPTMIEALKKKETRSLAIVALGKIGPSANPAVPELAKNLKEKEVQPLVIEALGNIGPQAKSAVPELADLLKESDKEIRPSILATLAKMGPEAKPAVAAIGSCLSVDDKETSLQGLAALAALGPDAKDAVPDIINLLLDEDLGRNNKLRLQAVKTLGKIGKPAVSSLTKALSQQNRYMKVGAIEALGEIGPDAKEAIKPIERLASNPDPEIRLAAIRAIRKIQP